MNAVFNPGLLNLSTVDVLGQMVLDCGERASLCVEEVQQHPWRPAIPTRSCDNQKHLLLLLLLLLSRFSRVRLCATPQTAAHQAPPSLGFSRQEHWSGLPFPLQCMKVKSEREVAQSCPTLSDPMDCSLPGSSIHGIFQARVLEWGAIARHY